MNSKFIGISYTLAFLFYFLCFENCKKETKTPCAGDFSFETPIQVNYLQSRMLITDTLTFRIEVTQKNKNTLGGETVDVSVFQDLWGGIRIIEYIKDSSIGTGGFINSIPARTSFQFRSESNVFEIPNDLGRPSPEGQFFKYSKVNKGFIINLKMTPKKKGTFSMVFLESGFRDAFCYNSINHSILNYSNKDFEFLLEEAMGKPLYQYSPYNPELYIIRVE